MTTQEPVPESVAFLGLVYEFVVKYRPLRHSVDAFNVMARLCDPLEIRVHVTAILTSIGFDSGIYAHTSACENRGRSSSKKVGETFDSLW